MNTVHLNHPETMPSPPGLRKNCLPKNQSLMPKRLETTEMKQELDPVNILLSPVCSIRLVKRGHCRDIGRQEGIGRYQWRDIGRPEHSVSKILSFSKEANSSGAKKQGGGKQP